MVSYDNRAIYMCNICYLTINLAINNARAEFLQGLSHDCHTILAEMSHDARPDDLQGGTQLSFWYKCAARRAANGGLKNE